VTKLENYTNRSTPQSMRAHQSSEIFKNCFLKTHSSYGALIRETMMSYNPQEATKHMDWVLRVSSETSWGMHMLTDHLPDCVDLQDCYG